MRFLWIGLSVLSLLIVAPACQSTRPASEPAPPPLHNVEQGMSPSEVRAVMGDPQRTVRAGDEIQWMVYGTPSQAILIYFHNGTVVAIPRNPRTAYTASQ